MARNRSTHQLVGSELADRIQNNRWRRRYAPSYLEQILDALHSYVRRIERHTKKGEINFAHGFCFFRQSRALNRQANYLLAKNLLQTLDANKPAYGDAILGPRTLFKDIKRQRQELILFHRLDKKQHFVDRGINSCELKSIFKMPV